MDKKITVDKNTVTFLDSTGKDVIGHTIPASDITSIHIDKRIISKFLGFKKTETRVITITVEGLEKRLEIIESEEGGEIFAEYIQELEKYAKENRVSYRNIIEE